ncbi:MAG: HNH endonuclease [Thermodesulfobacteriota bacterium]
MAERSGKNRRGSPFRDTGTGEADIKREKNKARELRQSQWWKGRLSRGVCYYCGQTVPPSELTMEHIVPISRGGKTTRNNVVPACKDCNTKKNRLVPVEWEEYLARLGGDKP